MQQNSKFKHWLKSLFYYHTTKVVQIRSYKLGFLYYFCLFIIIAYVALYAIYYQRGYQDSDTPIGSTSLKVKGSAYSLNGTDLMVWDAQDVVYPPKETDALFITTNYWQTIGQTRGICDGVDQSEKCPCSSLTPTLNGVEVGTCNNATNFCQLYAWCPVENEPKGNTQNILTGSENFSVFMRVSVKFPVYNILRTNVAGSTLTNGTNLFYVKELLSLAKYTISDVQETGGVFIVQVNWNCDFDKSAPCNPDPVRVFRIDQFEEPTASTGFNFRYTYHYYLPNETGSLVEYRDLYKVYGVRFIFLTSGIGRKFSIVPLFINIGSGLALLSVATIISDTIALYLLPKRQFYRQVKYEEVEDGNVKTTLTEDDITEETHLKAEVEFD
jgi:P2X purinoceptor 4